VSSGSTVITVDYENTDSEEDKSQTVCSGSETSGVTIKGRTTSASSIYGSASCKVKTNSGDVVLKGGEMILVKEGKFTIQK
jgi:hypothetical protein